MKSNEIFNYNYEKGVSALLNCLSYNPMESLQESVTVSIKTNDREFNFCDDKSALEFLKDEDLTKIQSVEILRKFSVYSVLDTTNEYCFTLDFKNNSVEQCVILNAEEPIL